MKKKRANFNATETKYLHGIYIAICFWDNVILLDLLLYFQII